MTKYTAVVLNEDGSAPEGFPREEVEFEVDSDVEAVQHALSNNLSNPDRVIGSFSESEMGDDEASSLLQDFSRSVDAGWDPRRGPH